MTLATFETEKFTRYGLATRSNRGAIHRARASIIHLLDRRNHTRLPEGERQNALHAHWESYFRDLNLGQHPLEQKLTRLDHGLWSLILRPGYRAISGSVLTITHPGQNILASQHLSLKNLALFGHGFRKLGIEVRFFDPAEPAAIAQLADAKTRAVFVESTPNPTTGIPELSSVAHYAHNMGVPLLVDNSWLTPANFSPIEQGADIVVYSHLNFLYPERRAEADPGEGKEGAIVDSGRFIWTREPERWPEFNQPALGFHHVVFTEALARLGNLAYLAHLSTHWN